MKTLRSHFLLTFLTVFFRSCFFVQRHGRGAGIITDASGLHLITVLFHEVEELRRASGREDHRGDMRRELDIGGIDTQFGVCIQDALFDSSVGLGVMLPHMLLEPAARKHRSSVFLEVRLSLTWGQRRFSVPC